jgi:DNA-directed RNA polymerase subunit F
VKPRPTYSHNWTREESKNVEQFEEDLTEAYKKNQERHQRYQFKNGKGKGEIAITLCPHDPASLHIIGNGSHVHMGKEDIQNLIELLQKIIE